MTQVEQVAVHLKKYGQITSIEAFGLYRITRLSSCIYILRKAGMPIETVLEYDGKRHWAVYKMPLPVDETEKRQEAEPTASKFNTLFLGGQL